MNRMIAKLTAWTGAAILIATAGFHLTGLAMVKDAAMTLDPPFLAAVMEPLWLLPSSHWFVFAVIAVLAASRQSNHSRILLLLTALAVIIDAGLLFARLGPFIGAMLLGFSGLLFLVSALVLPSYQPVAKDRLDVP